MDTSALSATALWLNHTVASAGGTEASGSQLFSDAMAQLQLQEEILSYLQGVPMDTVSIPPDIRKRMLEDQSYYDHIMYGLDEYVKAYKKYSAPGVVTMSFFITADGEYCIRGVNEVLKQFCETQDGEEQSDCLFEAADGADGVPEWYHTLVDANWLCSRMALVGYDDDRFKRWSWA